jgi:hypothetical protein
MVKRPRVAMTAARPAARDALKPDAPSIGSDLTSAGAGRVDILYWVSLDTPRVSDW